MSSRPWKVEIYRWERGKFFVYVWETEGDQRVDRYVPNGPEELSEFLKGLYEFTPQIPQSFERESVHYVIDDEGNTCEVHAKGRILLEE